MSFCIVLFGANINPSLKSYFMVVVIDKKNQIAHTYTTKSDVARLMEVSSQTVWKWAKRGSIETPQYIVLFNVEQHTNRLKRRKTGFI